MQAISVSRFARASSIGGRLGGAAPSGQAPRAERRRSSTPIAPPSSSTPAPTPITAARPMPPSGAAAWAFSVAGRARRGACRRRRRRRRRRRFAAPLRSAEPAPDAGAARAGRRAGRRRPRRTAARVARSTSAAGRPWRPACGRSRPAARTPCRSASPGRRRSRRPGRPPPAPVSASAQISRSSPRSTPLQYAEARASAGPGTLPRAIMGCNRTSALALCLMLRSHWVRAAPSAHAGTPLEKGFWGPAEINGVSQFPIYDDLGRDDLPDVDVVGRRGPHPPGRRSRPQGPRVPVAGRPRLRDHARPGATG